MQMRPLQSLVVTREGLIVIGAWRTFTPSPPSGPRATLYKSIVATAGSRDHDSSAQVPVSSRTRRKLMSTHREDGQSVIFAEVHRSEESSDGDEYEQSVAVGGRCEKLDAASQCNDTDGGVAATVVMGVSDLLNSRIPEEEEEEEEECY